MDYQALFHYVQNCLDKSEEESGKFPFRKRSDHIRRVYIWAKRLAAHYPDVNKDLLFTAALFHDVGYAAMPGKEEEHAKYSREIFIRYAQENNYPQEFIDSVGYLIANHSHKELMTAEGTCMELILLMEADLLDETGAMAIIWDAMAEGNENEQSFSKTYTRLMRYTEKLMKKNPMVTPYGKELWQKKQALTKEFMDQLAFDLCEEI